MSMTLIEKLEAGIAATAGDGNVITMRIAGPASARVITVKLGSNDVHYQAPLSRTSITEAAAVASNLLAIHNL